MLFLLLLTVALAFSLPRVQTFAAHKAETWLAEWLDVEFSFESISIKGLSRVAIDELYIADLAGDTLIYAERASAVIDRTALLHDGEFKPADVRMENGWLNLYTLSNGRTNIESLVSHVEERLPKQNSSGKPFIINGISVLNSRFTFYDAGKFKPQKSGINYADMDVDIERLDVGIVEVVGEDVMLSIDHLTAADKSGSALQHSSIERMVVKEADLLFYDTRMYVDDAYAYVPEIFLYAQDWSDYDKFNSSVVLEVKAEKSYLTAEALEQFVPDLGNVGVDLKDVVCRYSGTVDDFKVEVQSAVVEGAILAGRVRIKNVTDLPQASFAVDSLLLAVTAEQAQSIYKAVTKSDMPAEVKPWAEKFDYVKLDVVANAAGGSLSVGRMEVESALGDASVQGVLSVAQGGEYGFDGRVVANGIDVGRVADVPELGKVWMNASLNGKLGEEYVDGNGEVHIDRFTYGNYTFRDIDLTGSYVDDVAKVSLRSADSALMCVLDAECDLSWLEAQFNVNLSVEGADLAAMGFAPEGSRSWLACNLEATADGSSVDELEGRAMINDFVYISSADTLSTELINVVVGNSGANEKSISLYSPLVDVEYRSRASYGDVVSYLSKELIRPLPLGKNAPRGANVQSEEESGAVQPTATTSGLYAAEDFSSVQVNINTDDRLLSVFVPHLNVAADSSMRLEFAPSVGEFALSVDSDYVEWQDWLASRVRVNAAGSGERMTVGVDANELLSSELTIPDVVVEAYAEEGSRLGATVMFSDNTSAVSGRLAVDGELWYGNQEQLMARASMKDSYVMLYDNRWDMAVEDIEYNSQSLAIDSFEISSGEQRILLDGELSDNAKVPLRLFLENIWLGAPAELLLGSKDIDGYANGKVELSSVLKRPFGEGVVRCDNMSAGGVQVAPMELKVALPQGGDLLSLTLKNSQLGTTLVRAAYDMEQKSYEGELTVTQLELAAFGSLAEAAVEDLQGDAVMNLSVKGRGSEPQIDGSVELGNVKAKVKFTGVEYTADRVAMEFDNNVGRLVATELQDAKGGRATLTGSVDLANLNDLKFDLQLLPVNLAVIDLASSKDVPFYGNVTASGAASVASAGGNVAIEAALTTGDGSVFSLPLSGSSDFASVDFVQFVDADTAMEPDTTDVVARRKMLMATKNRKEHKQGNTTIDAQIGVGTNTQLRLIIDEATDNVLVANGEADLNVTIDSSNSDLQIRGDYQIAEGYYNFNFQNLISKQFTISPGSYIRWNGSPLDANIDVDAVYKVKTSLAPLLGTDASASRGSTPVECIVNLGGSLADIDLSFDINVPTANAEYQSILSSYFASQEMMATQFVYLLAAGNFYSDGNSSTQGNTQGGATGTAIGLGLLVDQVSRLVSNDAYKFHVKYKMFDETASTYGVDFETEIIDDKLLLEIEANVDTGNYYQTGLRDNNQLTGGGALTLLLNKTGDFILKGFSRTIDRFDENQGLQENGLGIYYRRSFDSFSDLWRKKENKAGGKSKKSDTFVNPQTPDTEKSEVENDDK